MASIPVTDDGVSTPEWYALAVGPNRQFAVRDWLNRGSVESFLPTVRERSRWSDRQKTIERPVFPGYVFARFSLAGSHPIKSIPGVIAIVGRGSEPESIPGAELDSLRRVIEQCRNAKPCEFVRGEKVEIKSGPFANVRGVVLRSARNRRKRRVLVVGVEMLKRAVAVEIDFNEVSRLNPSQRPRLAA